jgi:mannosylglycerate hydrolase
MVPTTPQPTEVHIISHTHWDREWYKPFQGFRHFLVKVIDEILDRMETDPEYRYFHLDGQTIVLEDYTDIRPERIPELRSRIQGGRILIGPWYDSPDLFTVDGESLVRNLQLGMEICGEWGAEPLRNGYAVDNFGHNSQMPQIYAGFGMDTSTLFRGTNAQAAGSLFIWVGADGTECLVLRLSDHTAYSNFWYAFRPVLTQLEAYQEETAKKTLNQLIEVTAASTPTPVLLFMDGVDHITANPLTTRIIRDAKRFRPDIQFIHSTLPEFIRKTHTALENGVRKNLPRLQGELRIPNKDGDLNRFTTDVSSSRIYLKIQNKECETALLRWLEPFRALASTLGIFHPSGFPKKAWKYLLMNHPHDSICGCSVDQVHRDMEYRFAQSRSIAEVSTGYLLNRIGQQVATSFASDDEGVVLVYNPGQNNRPGVQELAFDVPEMATHPGFTLRDPEGVEVPHQILSAEEFKNRVGYNPIRGAHGDFRGKYVTVAVDLRDLPALGYSALRIQSNASNLVLPKPLISENHAVMENPFLRVEIGTDGLLNLLHKPTSRTFNGLHGFEDCGEAGDLWVHAKPVCDRVVRGIKSAQVSLVRNGPLLATYRVEYCIDLPSRATPDLSGRSEETIEQRIISDFTLTSSSPYLRVETHLENVVRDHRLRVLFPSGIQTDFSHASSQFDVVTRGIALPDTRGWRENASETKPNQGFVEVNDGTVGLCVTNFGMTEYAVYDDPQRTIGLTLVRAVRAIVGVDGEGEGQCLRNLDFRYAIYPHAGTWEAAEAYRMTEENNLSLKAIRVESHPGTLPCRHSFLSLSPANLILSSFRNPIGSGNEAVVRVYNPTGQEMLARITTGFPVAKACFCNLNDEPGESIELRNGTFEFPLGPKKIASIRMVFDAPAPSTGAW